MSKLNKYMEIAKYNKDLTEMLDAMVYDPNGAEILAASIERAVMDGTPYFNPKEFLIKLQVNLDIIQKKLTLRRTN